MILHLLKHKGPKIFPCPLCSYKCASFQCLEQHKDNHNTPKTKCVQYNAPKSISFQHHTPINQSTQVRCNLCGKFFENHKSKSHFSKHIGGDVYKCSKCHKMFNLFPDLSKHSKTCKESLEHVKAFSCSFCYKQFDRQQHINTHIRFHTGRNHTNVKCVDSHSLLLVCECIRRDVRLMSAFHQHRPNRWKVNSRL